MATDIFDTALGDIDGINRAFQEAGLRSRVARPVGGTMGSGNYATGRYVTTLGGHVLIKFYRYRGMQDDQDIERVALKSVCRVRNKWRAASMLINGQASTNAMDTRWWHDGDGPTVYQQARATAV